MASVSFASGMLRIPPCRIRPLKVPHVSSWRTRCRGVHAQSSGALPRTPTRLRLVARIRSTVHVVKLTAMKSGAASQWAVRGHTISIPHDGPEVVVTRLPDLAALRDHTSFYGTIPPVQPK